MNKDTNINNIIDIIFNGDPKPPCSYIFEFSNDNITLFQFLMSILILGIKKLYGENFILNKISKKEFILINNYMESIGYTIKYNYIDKLTSQLIEESSIDNMDNVLINIWFEKYIEKINCHGNILL